MINDKQIGDLIESSGGVWVEDEFRISSKELDSLLVEAARATPADHSPQARNSVIEECAKVCDVIMAEYERNHENGHSSGAYWCAEAIRALTTPSDERRCDADPYQALASDYQKLCDAMEDANEHIQALQKALFYWMPPVFDDRSAQDASLLIEYEGELEEAPSRQEYREVGVWEPDGSKFKTYREENLDGVAMFVKVTTPSDERHD
jgi:hypothetical protein